MDTELQERFDIVSDAARELETENTRLIGKCDTLQAKHDALKDAAREYMKTLHLDEAKTLRVLLDPPKKETIGVKGAALRCAEEGVRLTERPVHDGTRMVLVPEVLFEQLEQELGLDPPKKEKVSDESLLQGQYDRRGDELRETLTKCELLRQEVHENKGLAAKLAALKEAARAVESTRTKPSGMPVLPPGLVYVDKGDLDALRALVGPPKPFHDLVRELLESLGDAVDITEDQQRKREAVLHALNNLP